VSGRILQTRALIRSRKGSVRDRATFTNKEDEILKTLMNSNEATISNALDDELLKAYKLAPPLNSELLDNRRDIGSGVNLSSPLYLKLLVK